MDAWVVLSVALLGLPVGWVAGVLIDRIPDEKPLWRPRPRIPWPSGFAPKYAVVDALMVALFAAGAIRFSNPSVLVAYLFLFAVLLTLSAIDVETLRLPDRLVFPALGVSVLLIVVISVAEGAPRSISHAALGGAVYFSFLFLAHLAYPRGMGFGDVKASLLMGLYLGWLSGSAIAALVMVLYAMLIGFAIGSVSGLAILIARGRSAAYPFGPFLALGTVAAILLSEVLLSGDLPGSSIFGGG